MPSASISRPTPRSCSRSFSRLASILLGSLLASIAACGKSGEGSSDAAGGGGRGQSAPAPRVVAPATMEALNRAVGLMGRFEFEEAAQAFRAVVEAPGATGTVPLEARLGLAIATLNQSREGAQDEALALLADILKSASAPDAGPEGAEIAVRANYCSGLCQLFLGRADQAAVSFRRVVEARGGDAYANYFLAQSLEQVGDGAAALPFYERAAERDPYLKSAFLGVQRCAQRAGDARRAESALAIFEKLAVNPRGRAAEFKYTRMGPLGLAIAPEVAPAAFAPREGPLFGAWRELAIAWPDGVVPAWSEDAEQHAVVGDIDGDGVLDLILSRAVVAKSESGTLQSRALVLLGAADGSYRAMPDHSLSRLAGGGVNSILLGDIDADGRTDAYICRSGGNRLLLAAADGSFRDATESAQAAGSGKLCVDGALADLDHDGDLDLFLLFADDRNDLLINNLDGTFRSIARDAGLATEDRGPKSVVVGDFDYDRDADILVLNTILPHELYLNDRLWKWTPGVAPGVSDEQLNNDAVGAAFIEIADIPLRRLVLATSSYLKLPRRIEQFPPMKGVEIAADDVTGDGRANIVLLGNARIAIHDAGGKAIAEVAPPEGAVHCQLIRLDPTRGPSLIAARVGKPPLVADPGAGRSPYAAVAFSGRTDPSQSMRSNTSGIGASYAARIGSEWFGGETFRSHTGRGQSLAPVSIGLGPFAKIDALEVEWSDGVFQSELDLAAGALHRVTETQRQISSCPVLFAWNGSELRFVSDLLGVGGIGYLLEPGVYSEPRPWEHFVLPEDALVPKADGSLSLSLAEPMEESCMLDAVSLRAVDLPTGWDIAPDERLAIGGAAPTGETVAWRRSWLPKGDDALASVDLRAREVGAHDPRFIGRLAGEQSVELEFDADIGAIDDPWLVVDGWVEYPYCQTMFAAWQAGARYRAPSLEARGADGSWTTLVEEWGYPAGMPRRMALPIPREKLPAGATALRMRTNMEVYFDSVRLVAREPLPAEPRPLALVRANLASVGFARRSTGPQKQPFYDRGDLLPLWDCRFQRGLYSPFGDVRPQLATADGSLVVFGPGEEVAFDFAAPTEPPAPGTTRRYLLETRGWCKDMDLFTRDGETIAPLPAGANATGLTRPMGGR